MNGCVLLADDEAIIHELLTQPLVREGFAVEHAYTGDEAIALARRIEPDIMLLDLMLPVLDGFEVCTEVRKTHTFPILFLSARGEEVDKLVGLSVGADDYITKPFSVAEVVARVRAQLRRRQRFDRVEQSEPAEVVRVGGMTIDAGTAEVHFASGRSVTLTAKELSLLLMLARSPGRIWTKKQLYEAAWGSPYLGDDNTVMVTIRRLREKIEATPESPKLILTVRGLGYKLSQEREP